MIRSESIPFWNNGFRPARVFLSRAGREAFGGRFSRRGFSLIELLAVLAVVAIMTALAAGGFSYNPKLSTAASRIWGFVGGARQLAVTVNRPVRFFFVTGAAGNPEEWRYRAYGIAGEKFQTSGANPGFAFELSDRIQYLPAGVFFAAGSNVENPEQTARMKLQNKDVEIAYIEFAPTGGTTSGSPGNIFQIEAKPAADQAPPNDHSYAKIGVAGMTGRVRMEMPE